MFHGLFEIAQAYNRSRESLAAVQAGAGQDRRGFFRVPVKTPCRMFNSVFGLESAGETLNVSLDGVGLLAPVNWSEGSRIRVRLDESGFEAKGVIAFRKAEPPQFRYGVKFEQTGLLELIKLRRFLLKHHGGRLIL